MTLFGGGTLMLNGTGSTISGGSLTINQGALAVADGDIAFSNSAAFVMGNSGLASDTPTYTQNGGSVTLTTTANNIYLGNKANTGLTTFNLNGGNFTATATAGQWNNSSMYVGSNSNAVLNINGGTLCVAQLYAAGNDRTCRHGQSYLGQPRRHGLPRGLRGGLRRTAPARISAASCTFPGGTANFACAVRWASAAGTTTAPARIIQTGGLVKINSTVFIPQNAGYGGYVLSAGTLTTSGGYISIGNVGYDGSFSQTGGLANLGSVDLAIKQAA